MRTKKILTLVAAILAAAMILSACSGGSSPAASAGSAAPAATSAAAPAVSTAPPVAEIEAATGEIAYPLPANSGLSWWYPMRAVEYQASHDENPVWKKVAENTGVNITWIHPASSSVPEQLTLLIASGNLPDILKINGHYDSAGGPAGGVEEGIFVDLTDYIVEFAPDYQRAITMSDLAYQMATTADNRIAFFAQVKQTAPAWERVTLRKDIQSEIGWGDRLPVTIDDYTELFAALKEIGIYGAVPAANGRDNQFLFPYGIQSGWYLDEDGNVGWGQNSASFKEYLAMMRDWYAAGYIHPDFTGTPNRNAMFDNKEVGMRINPSDISHNFAKVGGYEIHIVNYPRMYEGQPIRFEGASWDPIPADGIRTVVSTSCKDIELAVQFLNYGYSQEGADLYNWGIEGESYTTDANGKRSFTDLVLNNEKIPYASGQYIYKLHFGPKLAEPDILCNPGTIGDPIAYDFRLLYSDDPTVNNTGVIRFNLTVPQNSARAAIMTDIDTYANEMSLKFILGESDLDAEWDNYIATIDRMNIAEAIRITQEAADMFYSKGIPTDWIVPH